MKRWNLCIINSSMSSTLTAEKLIGFMIPQDIVKIGGRLSKDTYDVRKNVLTKRLQHTIDILKTVHWQKLVDLVKCLPAKITPIGFLLRARKMEFADPRSSDLIYTYILDIYTTVYYLHLVENNVENSIDYNEVSYE